MPSGKTAEKARGFLGHHNRSRGSNCYQISGIKEHSRKCKAAPGRVKIWIYQMRYYVYKGLDVEDAAILGIIGRFDNGKTTLLETLKKMI